MIKKLEGILRLAILCLGVYLVYTLYRPQADRLIREVKEPGLYHDGKSCRSSDGGEAGRNGSAKNTLLSGALRFQRLRPGA